MIIIDNEPASQEVCVPSTGTDDEKDDWQHMRCVPIRESPWLPQANKQQGTTKMTVIVISLE
eukprot:1045937-Pelagomonas_calceolata.AAC.7